MGTIDGRFAACSSLLQSAASIARRYAEPARRRVSHAFGRAHAAGRCGSAQTCAQFASRTLCGRVRLLSAAWVPTGDARRCGASFRHAAIVRGRAKPGWLRARLRRDLAGLGPPSCPRAVGAGNLPDGGQ